MIFSINLVARQAGCALNFVARCTVVLALVVAVMPVAAAQLNSKPVAGLPSQVIVGSQTASEVENPAQNAPAGVSPPLRLKPIWALPELSPNDPRKVDYFVLGNNLPVLLISDPNAEKAAAALDVNVGSGEDPLERAGLAHFLEHMLFLGTQKYPDAKEYQDFIQKNGGSHNAYTSLTHTNYFFDVNANELEGALDRFAQFFIKPLFNEEYVDRERNAVHSEFRSKYSTEFRREEDVIRQLVTPNHPMARFRTGNLDSLHNKNGELRKALLSFYGEHYSARNMRLVVIGKEPLAQLRAMVKPLFSAVNDFEVKQVDNDTPLFQSGYLPVSVAIVPNVETRSVSYTFPVEKNNFWMKKPLAYLGFILGHEGEGSLAWLLKEKGWAESLSAGQGMGWRYGDTFNVGISLTPFGLENLNIIDGLLFEYIRLMQKSGINEWRFDELKRLGEIDFNFKERSQPMMEASHLAGKMQEINSQLLFEVDYRLSEFDRDLIAEFASGLNPQNVLRVVTAPDVKTTQKTVLYDVPFNVNSDYQPATGLEQNSDFKRMVAELKLPLKNTFVPKSLALVEGNDAKPQRIIKRSRFNAWHLTNTEFTVPKATVRIRLKSAMVEQSVHYAAMTKFLTEAMEADLNPVTYQAAMAGANFNISATSRGIDMSFSGYSDSLEPLVDYIVNQLAQYAKGKDILQDTDRLKSIQQSLVRRYKNDVKDTPYRQMMSKLAATVYQPYWSAADTAAALEAADPNALAGFMQSLLKQSEVTVLTAGNLVPKQAKKIAKKINTALVNGRGFKPNASARVTQISGLNAVNIAAEHQDNATMIYVQGKNDSLQEQAAMQLFTQTLSTPFYHQLRTEQQLGYIVFASYYPVRDMPGVVFLVQSPQTDVQAIERAMMSFVKSFTPDLETQFHVHQLAVVSQLAEKPKNLSELVSKYWQSLNSADFDFNQDEQLIAAVESLEPKAYGVWYASFIESLVANQLIFYSIDSTNEKSKSAFSLIPRIDDLAKYKASQPSMAYP